MMSKWGGDVDNAFFSAEKFDKQRVLLQAEKEWSARSAKSVYYIIGVDVGRFDCTTEAVVFKCTPQMQGPDIKSVVNIYTYEAEHFEQQAIYLKKLFYQYKAKTMIIDGNGIGAGLVDFMVIAQVDPDTGDDIPPFGVENDEDGKYKKLKTMDTITDALYVIKANAAINTEAYSYVQTQMLGGKVKFLIDEQQAKVKLMSTKVGQNMSLDERNSYLRPYVQTSLMRDQILNLVQENDGVNIILKQSSRSIKKDKFSALMYGLYYIKMREEKKKRRKNKSITDFMFFT